MCSLPLPAFNSSSVCYLLCTCIHRNVHTYRNYTNIIWTAFSTGGPLGGLCACNNHGYVFFCIKIQCVSHFNKIVTFRFLEAERDYDKYVYTCSPHPLQFMHSNTVHRKYMYVFRNDCDNYLYTEDTTGEVGFQELGYSVWKLERLTDVVWELHSSYP